MYRTVLCTVQGSTGHILVKTRDSNQQGSKSRQNPFQVQPPENIGKLSTSGRCLFEYKLSRASTFCLECVCVCVLSIYSGHEVRWTYQPGSHRILPSAVRALIFLARMIQPVLSLVDRKVKFCILTISSFSTCWAFFFFSSEKNPDSNSRPNVS